MVNINYYINIIEKKLFLKILKDIILYLFVN